MIDFKLSDKLDQSKVFLFNLSQIEERLDPSTYHQDRLNAIKRLKSSGVELKPLKFLVSPNKQTVKSIPSEKTIYVGLENIESDTGYYIPTTEKDSISSALVFKKGDILFPKLRPYLNKVFFATFDGICSTEFHVFKSGSLNNEYLSHFLRSSLVVSQTEKLMSGNTLPRVQTEDIYNLLIPVISPEKQSTVVTFMDKAKGDSNALKGKAELLLAEIDSYILNELGINLPEKDTSIEARMFQTTFQELSGRRFDPSFHSYDFSLESTIHPNSPVLDLVDLEPGWKKVPKPETEAGFVPMDAVDDKMAAIVGTETRLVAEAKGYTKFQEGDVLWAKITPCMQNGKSAIANNLKNGYGFGSTEFFVLRCRSNVDPDYLLTLLRLKELRNCATLYFGGASGHQRVSPSFFKDLIIPHPPIEKQKEIGQEANRRRIEAQRLSIEADKILEDARAEIEKMILHP